MVLGRIVAIDMTVLRDMSTLPDLVQVPDFATLPDFTQVQDFAARPDMTLSCRARLPAIEVCRRLPDKDKNRQPCINQSVGADPEAGWLTLCVEQKCPGGTLLGNACVTPKCAPECCIAFQQCGG